MSENHQTRKIRQAHVEAVERLAKSSGGAEVYNGKELLESLYKCVEGCREWSKAEGERALDCAGISLDHPQRENVCHELLKVSEAYSIAADRTQIFISNLDNYDNID